MTDYICNECGIGFPEKASKVRVRPPYEGFDSWWEEWTWRLADSLFMRRYYEIHCPNCENVLIGNED